MRPADGDTGPGTRYRKSAGFHLPAISFQVVRHADPLGRGEEALHLPQLTEMIIP
jgi:hypothetical protein